MSAKKLSVVIVNYRSRAYLERCLPLLAADSLQPEVIVVDNDGSAAGLDTAYPHIRILAQSENRWFCEGNNIGIRVAQGEYVLLLNPDTRPQPDALATMVDFLAANPDYAGATLQLRYPDERIQRTCSRIPTYRYLLANHTPLGWLRPGWRDRLNGQQWYADWARDSDRDVEVLPGSCLLMRREMLRLNDALRLYFPEDDLAQRFRGAKFRFLSSTFIYHDEKSVTRSWVATRTYFRDLLVYTQRYHSWGGWLVLALCSRPLVWGMALKARFASG